MNIKLKEILSSIRFWLLFIGLAAGLLKHYGVLDEEVVKMITNFVYAVVGVGTADSVAKKLNGK